MTRATGPRSSSIALALTAAIAGCARSEEAVQAPLESPIFITAAGDTIRMREELRIGRLDGPDEYTFSLVTWTLPTRDGGVILYDLESSDGSGERGRIRQFDESGRFVRYIGGPGAGPGEYSSGPDGTLLTDGTLVIVDQSLARITRFDAQGSLLATWPGHPAMVELKPTLDGGWLVGVVTGYEPGHPRRIDYVRYDSVGVEVERFPAPDAYHNGPYCGVGLLDCLTSTISILPDGRMVSARNDSLAFTVHGPQGETRVSAPHQPVAYLPEEAAAREAMFKALARRSGGDGKGLEVPAFKKVFGHLGADRSGRVLVLLRAPGYKVELSTPQPPTRTPWREPLWLELFDAGLNHRGRLIAPRSVTRRAAAFTDDAVWLVHEGESGEFYLVKWRPDSVVW